MSHRLKVLVGVLVVVAVGVLPNRFLAARLAERHEVFTALDGQTTLARERLAQSRANIERIDQQYADIQHAAAGLLEDAPFRAIWAELDRAAGDAHVTVESLTLLGAASLPDGEDLVKYHVHVRFKTDRIGLIAFVGSLERSPLLMTFSDLDIPLDSGVGVREYELTLHLYGKRP